jgi:hypothetical protein
MTQKQKKQKEPMSPHVRQALQQSIAQKKQKEPMSPHVRQALQQSIAHWKRLRDGKERDDESTDGDSCALCVLFSTLGEGCAKCPVCQKTTYLSCGGSPWWDAHLAYWERDIDTASKRKWKTAAKRQVAFLESLLPKTRKPRRRG